jgi:hypothetical protein
MHDIRLFRKIEGKYDLVKSGRDESATSKTAPPRRTLFVLRPQKQSFCQPYLTVLKNLAVRARPNFCVDSRQEQSASYSFLGEFILQNSDASI